MADKARNLRKLLSKNKDNNKHKEHFNTQPTNEDDPLQFLDNNNHNDLSNRDNDLINDIIHKECRRMSSGGVECINEPFRFCAL